VKRQVGHTLVRMGDARRVQRRDRRLVGTQRTGHRVAAATVHQLGLARDDASLRAPKKLVAAAQYEVGALLEVAGDRRLALGQTTTQRPAAEIGNEGNATRRRDARKLRQ
jgi:hypothetical protein